MNIKNLTWLGFFITLSTVSIVPKTLAINSHNGKVTEELNTVETRLNRIAEVLKIREKNLPENVEITPETERLLGQFVNSGRGGWGNGRWRNGGSWIDTNRGSFANNRGPGGFLNNNRGGGFLNSPRNWRDGGSFWNRW